MTLPVILGRSAAQSRETRRDKRPQGSRIALRLSENDGMLRLMFSRRQWSVAAISPLLLIVGLLAALAAMAADEKVDPRAVTECTARGGSFVQIKQCLPEVHVGVKVIDAFAATFEGKGLELSERCVALNSGKSEDAATCVTEALRAARELKAQLPEGSTIPDPLFAVLADEKKIDAVFAAEKAAREMFGQRLWGGKMYRAFMREAS
jgi:hypothetical protein